MITQKTKGDMIDLNSRVDFTLLDPRATKIDIEKLCDVAYKNQYYAVCVNPTNVSYAKGYIQKHFFGSIKVVSVVGFPLGANSTDVKLCEVKEVIKDGADEIDVVINIGRAKEGDFAAVKSELLALKKCAKKYVIKVILETCYFDENDIIKLCKICAQVGVDYVKTSTGFGIGGADKKIVSLMHKEFAGKCKIKAAGGIRSREDALEYIALGADRIGCSRII